MAATYAHGLAHTNYEQDGYENHGTSTEKVGQDMLKRQQWWVVAGQSQARWVVRMCVCCWLEQRHDDGAENNDWSEHAGSCRLEDFCPT